MGFFLSLTSDCRHGRTTVLRCQSVCVIEGRVPLSVRFWVDFLRILWIWISDAPGEAKELSHDSALVCSFHRVQQRRHKRRRQRRRRTSHSPSKTKAKNKKRSERARQKAESSSLTIRARLYHLISKDHTISHSRSTDTTGAPLPTVSRRLAT